MLPLLSSLVQSIHNGNTASNWVVSPYSYLCAVQSLLPCAADENAAQIRAALGDLASPVSISDIEDYNALLSSHDYLGALNRDVLETLTSQGSELLTFRSSSEAIQTVNRLVEEKTYGRIKGLANESNITDLTAFIILNCVYFKRSWLIDFNEDNQAYDVFHSVNGDQPTKYLRKRAIEYHYHEDTRFDLVSIPYKDSNVQLYLFVPNEGYSTFDILNSFSEHYSKIERVKQGLEVDLTIPSFKIESDAMDLSETTKLAGITRAFEWGKEWSLVDWSKLKDEAALKVGSIVQKAMIDVNKSGTEAAAATMIVGGYSGMCSLNYEPPPIKTIRADKPFVFCLVDKTKPEIPLFVGTVNGVA